MDLLKAAIDHLDSELPCPVSSERPAEPPVERVTVVRMGGGGSQFVDRARILVHAWSSSDSSAYRLARMAEAAMFTLPGAEHNVAEVLQDSFYSNISADGTRRWSSAYIVTTNR